MQKLLFCQRLEHWFTMFVEHSLATLETILFYTVQRHICVFQNRRFSIWSIICAFDNLLLAVSKLHHLYLLHILFALPCLFLADAPFLQILNDINFSILFQDLLRLVSGISFQMLQEMVFICKNRRLVIIIVLNQNVQFLGVALNLPQQLLWNHILIIWVLHLLTQCWQVACHTKD